MQNSGCTSEFPLHFQGHIKEPSLILGTKLAALGLYLTSVLERVAAFADTQDTRRDSLAAARTDNEYTVISRYFLVKLSV